VGEQDEMEIYSTVCQLTGIFSLHQIKSALFITRQVSALSWKQENFLCCCYISVSVSVAMQLFCLSQGNC